MKNTIYSFNKLVLEINKYLRFFFKEKNKALEKDIKECCMRGGKRLRPALVYYGYKLFSNNNENDKEIIKASITLELIHTFFLIHDDFMDKSNLRRGKRTMHEKYKDRYFAKIMNLKKAKDYGDSMAVLAGDYSYMLGIDAILSSNLSSEIKIKVIKKINKMISDTIIGQELDIKIQNLKSSISETDILAMYKLKTAKYSFDYPLQVGAILSQSKRKYEKLISDYAISCGIAYQIKDDILDLFESKNTGKSYAQDIIEGKKTLLIIKAYEKASSQEKRVLNQVLGNKKIQTKDINKVKKIIEKTGAYEYCKQKNREYINHAKKALNKLAQKDLNKKVISRLEFLADFSIIRKY